MWTSDPPTLTMIHKCRKPDLIEFCKSQGMNPEGTVATLRKRLRKEMPSPGKGVLYGRGSSFLHEGRRFCCPICDLIDKLDASALFRVLDTIIVTDGLNVGITHARESEGKD